MTRLKSILGFVGGVGARAGNRGLSRSVRSVRSVPNYVVGTGSKSQDLTLNSGAAHSTGGQR